jgi:hypothetical protein
MQGQRRSVDRVTSPAPAGAADASGVLEGEQRLVVDGGGELVVLSLEPEHVGLEIGHAPAEPAVLCEE